MAQKRIVIIGGSAAGPKTAARARRLDQRALITLIERGPDLSMASCGYPYYVGGVFDSRNCLIETPTGVPRNPGFFLNAKNIIARVNCEVTTIDRAQRTVTCRNTLTGEVDVVPYDKLMIATGSSPRLPPLEGIDLEGVTTLQSMKDADYLRAIRDERRVKKAIIIGGGLIGIETAEALQLAGIEITIVELMDQLLPFLDWQLAKLVENHLKSKGVNVLLGNGVAAFTGEAGTLTGVKLASGTELPCELAVVAVGVKPSSQLAKAAGLEIGVTGGIKVNHFMGTTDPDIYAAGDCVEICNCITGAQTYAPMGDLANLQGRVAADNIILGDSVQFSGTINTGICKIFDFAAGATGLTEAAALKAGYDVETVVNASPDKPGFMGAKLLVSKMVVDRKTGKLLGYQCTGPGDVSKQVAQGAMAIRGQLTVAQMMDLDLPYAPPFSLAIDHFIASAHIMDNKLKGRMSGISTRQVREMQCRGEKGTFFLDARGPDEFEAMRLGIGEVLIPLGALRKRLGDLPPDKNHPIVCYCKISLRGYEAALILMDAGYTNVRVMEGGIMAWPFPREK
ncbi:FAD-dependent oxidoreductase [Myxococcota bacterium]|nr:FAD-dependent oxidoreductase [Myxococcota bacterium]MBU1533711.1 FAD-dependent oxidoreductase [Myxococcota bacterium]